MILFCNVPCRHCLFLKEEHAGGRKCLFSPTAYTPLSNEDQVLLNRELRTLVNGLKAYSEPVLDFTVKLDFAVEYGRVRLLVKRPRRHDMFFYLDRYQLHPNTQ